MRSFVTPVVLCLSLAACSGGDSGLTPPPTGAVTVLCYSNFNHAQLGCGMRIVHERCEATSVMGLLLAHTYKLRGAVLFAASLGATCYAGQLTYIFRPEPHRVPSTYPPMFDTSTMCQLLLPRSH